MISFPLVGLGAMTGFAIGLTGVGGGALMAPALVLLFGVVPQTAVATDLWFAVVTKLVAVQSFHGKPLVDWRIVRRLWWGSIPASIGWVMWVEWGHVAHSGKLLVAMGGVVVVTSLGILWAPTLFRIGRLRRLDDPHQFKRWQPLLTVVGGGVLGSCVALTSIGAGALGSVFLMYLYPLRMGDTSRLVATDIAHAVPLALVAGLGYAWAGQVDWWLLTALCLGSIPAVLAGHWVGRQVPGRGLQIVLACVLLFLGGRVLLSPS